MESVLLYPITKNGSEREKLCEKGTRKKAGVIHKKEKRSKTNFAPTW